MATVGTRISTVATPCLMWRIYAASFLCTFGKKIRADVTFAFLGVSIIRDLKLADNYLVPAWTIIGGTAVLTALNTCVITEAKEHSGGYVTEAKG